MICMTYNIIACMVGVHIQIPQQQKPNGEGMAPLVPGLHGKFVLFIQPVAMQTLGNTQF